MELLTPDKKMEKMDDQESEERQKKTSSREAGNPFFIRSPPFASLNLGQSVLRCRERVGPHFF